MPTAPGRDTGDDHDVADHDVAARKRAVRGPLLTTRRNRPDAERAAARTSVGAHLTAALGSARSVAAYLPLPTEPLDRSVVRQLADRVTVLIPVVTGPAPLDWCAFTDRTRPGQLGIEEPDGPRLGPEAIAAADAVLVPALAVSASGFRLGRGGGHYDRTLSLRSRLRAAEGRDDLLIALVYDDEYPIDVPHDDLDRPVTAVLTPSRGLVRLFPTPSPSPS